MGCHQSVGALRGGHQAVRPSVWRRGCRRAVRRDEDFSAAIRTCTAGLFRSETRVGRGRQGLLLKDDAAVRVQSGRARVSWALWAAKLVASDGRMNVANEGPSVESDEETFMDQHGRSLHLVGADELHEQERTTLRCVMALPGLLNRARSARAVGDRSLRSTALGATRIRTACIVIAWRPSPAIC
jgi:hypothetical protein